MPIAFDPPTHAPHGTLPTRGPRGVDDDPAGLDIFTQLLLAAASIQDANAPVESTSEPTPDATLAADAPMLGVPLPLSVTLTSGAGALAAAQTVTIVGREKVADVRVANAADARRLVDAQAHADALDASAGAPRDPAALLRDAAAGSRDASSARDATVVSASPAPAAPALATALVAEPVPASAPPPHAAAGAASAVATLAALLAPAGSALDKASAAKPTADLAVAPAQVFAAQQPAAPAPALHVETINAPAFTSGWQDETAGKLAQIVLSRTERAELRLHPAELGPVSVRIEMRADQASVQIVAASPETRSALEQSLPQLRDLLATQGITLGQASVHDGTAQRDARPEAWATAPRATAADDAATTSGEVVRLHVRPPDRLVDVFA